MRHKVKEKPVENINEPRCRHYWVIEMANGPSSQGVCKYCGEVREFLNSIPDLNVPKRRANPLDLPEAPGVELDEDSKS